MLQHFVNYSNQVAVHLAKTRIDHTGEVFII